MEFFISRNGQQSGPFSKDEIIAALKQGAFSYFDLSWHEGMKDWKPIKDVVFADAESVPSAVPFEPEPEPEPEPESAPPADTASAPEDDVWRPTTGVPPRPRSATAAVQRGTGPVPRGPVRATGPVNPGAGYRPGPMPHPGRRPTGSTMPTAAKREFPWGSVAFYAIGLAIIGYLLWNRHVQVQQNEERLRLLREQVAAGPDSEEPGPQQTTPKLQPAKSEAKLAPGATPAVVRYFDIPENAPETPNSNSSPAVPSMAPPAPPKMDSMNSPLPAATPVQTAVLPVMPNPTVASPPVPMAGNPTPTSTFPRAASGPVNSPVAAAPVIVNDPKRHSIYIEAKAVTAGSDTKAAAGYYSTSRDYLKQQKLNIRVQNLKHEPDEVQIEWFFFGKPAKGNGRFIYDQGSKTTALPAGGWQTMEVSSKELSANVISYDYGPRSVSGNKPEGWAVRALADGKVLRVAGSTPVMEALARDDTEMAKLTRIR